MQKCQYIQIKQFVVNILNKIKSCINIFVQYILHIKYYIILFYFYLDFPLLLFANNKEKTKLLQKLNCKDKTYFYYKSLYKKYLHRIFKSFKLLSLLEITKKLASE